MRKTTLAHQLKILTDYLECFHRPITMLNVLHNRTDLDKLEIGELQTLLAGVEDLLLHHLLETQNRIAFIEEMEVKNG